MLDLIQGAYNGLKAAGDLAQGFVALKTEAEKNAAIISIQRNVVEGQRALMEADTLHAADLRRISELEQEIVRLKDWSAEKQRYELVSIWKGTVAYAEKSGVENRQAPHWLCPNCFQQGDKSPLQWQGGAGSTSVYQCNKCKGTASVDVRRQPT